MWFFKPRQRATRVISIANQKGGVGKTTTTVNLAACVAASRRKVLVVDLDPQANATSGLGVPAEEGRSLYRALLGEGAAADLIRPTAVRGVDLIPSELDLAGAEIDVARIDSYLHGFTRALAPIIASARYDFVLIDCPPSLGILTMNALTGSHAMIAPIQCEYYALEGLSVISRLVRKIRDSGANPALEIEGILMTMYDSRTNLAGEVIAEVRKHFGEAVYRTVIPRNVRLSEAPSFGEPIIVYDRHCPGARAYVQFAREFLARVRQRERDAAGATGAEAAAPEAPSAEAAERSGAADAPPAAAGSEPAPPAAPAPAAQDPLAASPDAAAPATQA